MSKVLRFETICGVSTRTVTIHASNVFLERKEMPDGVYKYYVFVIPEAEDSSWYAIDAETYNRLDREMDH